MNKGFLIGFVIALLSLPAHAALNILATVPEWAALAKELGGSRVTVNSATTGLQDPHRIEAKPSLIAKARSANLVVATGAELEVGWLPVVLRESGNRTIQAGTPGYFEAATAVTMLDVPKVLDRAHGDVHAAGNPHIQTDPRNILRVADALAARMIELDPAEAMAYRTALQEFSVKWRAAIVRWEKEAADRKAEEKKQAKAERKRIELELENAEIDAKMRLLERELEANRAELDRISAHEKDRKMGDDQKLADMKRLRDAD